MSENTDKIVAVKVLAEGDDASPCSQLLSTGDLARDCETTVRTVRFYEEAGLIEPSHRSGCGHRMFERRQLVKLQLIMDLREAGLSLSDIKALFDLKASCDTADEASRSMASALETQIEAMQKKIAVLRRLREELAAMVAVIRECNACEAPDFKKQCGSCDVMARPDLPRAMQLLWGDDAPEAVTLVGASSAGALKGSGG